MKKLFFSACVLVVGFVFMACSQSSGGTGILPITDTDTTPVTYSGTDNTGKNVELKVAKTEADLSKAAITPASGDWYWLKLNGTEISRGTIAINSITKEWTFNATAGTVVTGFKATVSGTLKFTTDVKSKTGGIVIIAINTQLGGGGGGTTVPTELQGYWIAPDLVSPTILSQFIEFTDTTMHFGSIVYSEKDEGHLLTVTSVNNGTIYASDIPILTDYTFSYEFSPDGQTLTVLSTNGSGSYSTSIDATNYTKQPQ